MMFIVTEVTGKPWGVTIPNADGLGVRAAGGVISELYLDTLIYWPEGEKD